MRTEEEAHNVAEQALEGWTEHRHARPNWVRITWRSIIGGALVRETGSQARESAG